MLEFTPKGINDVYLARKGDGTRVCIPDHALHYWRQLTVAFGSSPQRETEITTDEEWRLKLQILRLFWPIQELDPDVVGFRDEGKKYVLCSPSKPEELFTWEPDYAARPVYGFGEIAKSLHQKNSAADA